MHCCKNHGRNKMKHCSVAIVLKRSANSNCVLNRRRIICACVCFRLDKTSFITRLVNIIVPITSVVQEANNKKAVLSQ